MNERRYEFLFATWDGGGNLGPVITAGLMLQDRGHGVRVVSDPPNRSAVEAAGLEFIPWRRPASHAVACDDWQLPGPEAILPMLRDCLISGPAQAQAEDLRDALRARPADVVVGSDLMFGPMIAAEAEHVPLAILATNVWLFPTIPGVVPFGPGLMPATDEAGHARDAAMAQALHGVFDEGLPALNRTRAAFRLPPLARALDQFGVADLILMGVARAFDFAPAELPDHIYYVGPLLDEVPAVGFELPWPADNLDPLVLVAFSTTFQNQVPVLQQVLDGLAGQALRVLVTLGPAIPAEALVAPANARLCARAPHDWVLARADAVITHAGHGTVARALLAGTPLLCLPMGRDQIDNSVRVVAGGAGLMLDAGSPADAIGSAVSRLLDEPDFALAAWRLGTEMAREVVDSPLIERLEALAANRPRLCAAG